MESTIWTEKYRPKEFSEIKGQEAIISKVKAFVEQKNMPHLLFSGPAGVGKSTTALVIARQLFGEDWKMNFLEFNASDERGIDVVRNKVKDFARTRAMGNTPFKIIFLDESDALTKEAQQALRRTMENYTATTRFILSCVTPDTKILLPEEREIMVNEFIDQYEYNPQHIHVQNVSHDCGSTKKDVVLAAVRLPASSIGKNVLEITTMTGRKLKLTEDHKLLTRRGWLEAGKLTKEDELLVYPHLEGTPVENNVTSIVNLSKFIDFITITEEQDIETEFNIKISYTTVRKSKDTTLLRGRADRVIGELKRKDLLDLTYNDVEKVGALARICGFMLGDGHLVRDSIRLHFSGNKQALQVVQADLRQLGYNNYSKITSITARNVIQGRKLEGVTTSFTLDSKALSLLLQYLGIPTGDKTITPYQVPSFIRNGTQFVKREFLRALFGCDGDKPQWKNMNFAVVSLRQNKVTFLTEDMLLYYKQLEELFKVFDVTTYVKIRDKHEIRKKDNHQVFTFDLIIQPNNKNLFKFFSRVGYAYEEYKSKLARLSSEYLRHKLFLISQWEKKSQLVVAAIKSGENTTLTAAEFGVTTDFIRNQIKGKEVHLPRKQFMGVDMWIKTYYENDLLVINQIVDIKQISEDTVMDITCQEDHNFITNGFVSHNCNYSSKLIDPIQSRCTLFRFKPLAREYVFSILDKIAQQEGITLTSQAQEALYLVSHGDCRRMENILQSCAAVSQQITEELIHSLASSAQPEEIRKILTLALENKFIEARTLLLHTMLKYGLSGLDIVKQIQSEIWHLTLADEKKVKLVDRCGDAEFRLVEGADEFVQLEALLANFTLCGLKG